MSLTLILVVVCLQITLQYLFIKLLVKLIPLLDLI